ncbi:flavin-containing monooxygenase [Ningiella sp. W23]|uniref:flavin-containing monooxygenase n=1 Tax=Ningiella sp. W23 TaxID=3023715 RepID=UPI003756F4D0
MEKKHHKVVIVGSGFGGQCAAINLKQNHIADFVILERRDFVGGTWTQNSYPGAAVDVQSILYSFSFEPYDWSRMFAHGDELRRYTDHIFKKYNLKAKTRTGQNVTSMQWDDDKKLWTVTVNDGQQLTADYVINSTGPLSTPVIPKFKGAELFKGASFHTNDWQHDVDLSNKNVAIVGSGASAAQVIPAIASKVKKLHVFQRSPHWVIPRKDTVFKKWQRWLLANKLIGRLFRWLTYWALESRIIGFKYSKTILNLWVGKVSKQHLENQIEDPVLRAKLLPNYTIGCKRIIVSSTLYPALAQKNVELHDKTDGIAEIRESSILSAAGKELDVDIIVFSTGYDATDGIISYPIYGKEKRELHRFWADYPRAYLGTSIPNFPNLFIVTGPNTGIGHTSAIFIIESQMKYILKAIKTVEASKASSIEVTSEAEEQYTKMIHSEMSSTVWQQGGCNSWYKGKSGKVIAMFPGFSFTFRRMCKKLQRKHHLLE